VLRAAVRAYASQAGADALPVAESPTAYSVRPVVASLPGLARVLALRSEIAVVCASAGVARLWVFGSAVRDDFDPACSDFDFLVDFRADAPRKAWLGEFADLQDALSKLLGSAVDLGAVGGLDNPYVQAAVNAEKVLVYEHS
jgi:uncharacterized protein